MTGPARRRLVGAALLAPLLGGALLLAPVLPGAPAATSAATVGGSGTPDGQEAVPVRVLLANVGNVNASCLQDYVVKLCQTAVEQRAAAALADVRPDVAVLVEVLPDDWCPTRRPDEPDPTKSCSGPPEPVEQVRRLLGPDYDYRCDTRYGWDCVAVRADVASFTSAVTTAPAPDGCDDGFTVSGVDVVVRGAPLRVLAGHPDSGDDACRAAEMTALLDLGVPGRTLLAGDLNLDPFREEGESVDIFRAAVGPERPLTHHNPGDALTSFPAAASQLDPSGTVLDGPVATPLPPGSSALSPRTLDHVASDALAGTCEVVRVDGGGGMDHRALDCPLTLRAGAPEPVVPEARAAALLVLAGLAVAGGYASRRLAR